MRKKDKKEEKEMAGNPKFWSGFKVVILVLLVVTIIGSVLSFIVLPGAQGTFFGVACLILALNLLLMYFFIRINDRRRPSNRRKSSTNEPSRFDFRKRGMNNA